MVTGHSLPDDKQKTMIINQLSSRKRSFLVRVNPLAKIAASLVFTSIAFALQEIQTAGLVASVFIFLILWEVKLTLRLILITIGLLMIFTLIAVGLSQGDWNFAIANTFRLLAITLPTPLLSATTPPASLVRALQLLRLPSFLVLSVMLTWRFLPLMQRETTRIIEANQLRGIDLSRQPRYLVSGLFIPLIFRIVSYADEVAIGLETRGYDPDSPRSMSQPLTWSFSDTIFTITSLGLLLGIIYV